MAQSGHHAAKAEPNKTINDRALQLVVSNIIKLARRADLFALAIRWQSETSIFLIAATAADSRSSFFLSVRAVSFGFFDQRLAFLNDPLCLPWQSIAGSPLPLPRVSHGDNERHTVTRSQFRLLRIWTASGLNFHQL
jgi:hypothetical protein